MKNNNNYLIEKPKNTNYLDIKKDLTKKLRFEIKKSFNFVFLSLSKKNVVSFFEKYKYIYIYIVLLFCSFYFF